MGLRFTCFQLFCRILGWAGARCHPTQNNCECKSGVQNTQLQEFVFPHTNTPVWRLICWDKHFHQYPKGILTQIDCELLKNPKYALQAQEEQKNLENPWIIITENPSRLDGKV